MNSSRILSFLKGINLLNGFYENKHLELEYGVKVQTSNGTISGKTYILEDGRRVNAFLGVPYAKNGTGINRFKKAEPMEHWSGTINCVNHGPRAIQKDLIFERFIANPTQSEEHCLNLNIFAPAWDSKEFVKNGRPVMIFIHGGGYLIHSASKYGDWNFCKNICVHDVIVCVIQYRLGLLGFMATGDETCPGNFGLWDQLLAIHWIKENINNFGGDSENITLFGQSAGAASVDLLSLSSYSTGLFNKIILMGGNASADWALSSKERILNAALRIARNSGFSGDTEGLLEFLKVLPSQHLCPPLVGRSAFNRSKNGLELCPVIDGDLIDAPITEMRKNLNRKLSVIIGTSDYEALLFHSLGKNQSDIQSIEKLLRYTIPDNFKDSKVLREKAKKLYLDGVDISDNIEVSRAFLELYSDTFINNSVQKYCHEMVAQGHDVYLYNFTHFNPDEFGILGFRMPFYAATHCHEVRYTIGKGLYSKFRPNIDDLRMLNITNELFTNFAKYGDPNGQYGHKKWNKLTPDNTYNYFELCLYPKMNSSYQNKRYEFWKNIESLKNMKSVHFAQ